MASKGSIAALLDGSLKRLQTAMTQVVGRTGIDAVAIPTHNRDPQLLIAMQVEAMAIWAEGLAARFQAPDFEILGTVEEISAISVPEDTAANLLILVGALAQRAGLDVDTPVPADDEALDLVSRLERRLAAAMPDIELMPMNTSETGATSEAESVIAMDADGTTHRILPNDAEDGDRDTEDADPAGDEALDASDTPPASDETQKLKKRPTPPKAKD